MNKIEVHKGICEELNKLYEAKNHDYGDSFAKLRKEIPSAILVRAHDKYSRLKTLKSGNDARIKNENIRDTLIDLANYCIMELIEMEIDKRKECVGSSTNNL